MLTRLTEAEFDRYAPWAYSLAMSKAHCSYPTWQDGIKNREDFMARARRSFTDEEVLLFWHDGKVRGWIQWFAIPKENYAMTVSFWWRTMQRKRRGSLWPMWRRSTRA